MENKTYNTNQPNHTNEETAARLQAVISNLLKTDTGMLHKGLDSLADPEMPVNLEGVEYRGINALLLRNAQFNNGYPSSEWATFDQWKKAGHSVRKGEKGTMMFFFIETFEDQGSDAKKKIEYSYANLFNRYQLVHEDSK